MNLKELTQQNNFEFKKKFGQNFISDTNLLKAIVSDAKIKSDDEVLEIGCGAGTLTNEIALTAKKVVAFEIDKDLDSILKANVKSPNASIVFKDFMQTSAEEVNAIFSKPYKVVANLPYYITSPIIFKLIEENYNVTSLTIMVQKEVAERLVAKEGTKDYGTITAQIGSIANANITRIVNRKMFTPEPNVDSAVVNIEINKNKFDILSLDLHRKVIEASFAMRRKTLSNCLKSKLNLNGEQIETILTKIGLPLTIRGEALSTTDFVNLSNEIYLISKSH